MSLIVQKFGGSSLKDYDFLFRAANTTKKEFESSNQVVVVVSARGNSTDNLLNEAQKICGDMPIPKRELDALLSTGEQASAAFYAMALQKLGVDSISLTGAQAGILTDSCPNAATILSVDKKSITNMLEHGKVVIVTGFQGIDEHGNITTLGRGGSDTSAAAIAAELNADRCMIYTDVDGVYTADPRLVPGAIRYKRLSYEEMLEFSMLGAKVLSSGSALIAKESRLPLTVLSSSRSDGGTLITNETYPHFGKITGITKTSNKNTTFVAVVCPSLIQNIKTVSEAAELLSNNGIETTSITIQHDSFKIQLSPDSVDTAIKLLHKAYFES